MGKLIVVDIAVSDFGSYAGGDDSLHGITLNGRGPVAIVGPNGAGKSTLVSKALTWCLYGTFPPERMGSGTRALTGADVIREGAPDCSVTVQLRDVDTGTAWLINRLRKRKGTDFTMMAEGGADFAPCDQSAIDSLIGAAYEVFTRTCVRGQNDPWNFAEATDARKREILDAISGADALVSAYTKAKDARESQRAFVAGFRLRAEDAERRASVIDVDALAVKEEQWNLDAMERAAEASAEHDRLVAAHKRVIDEAAVFALSMVARDAVIATEPRLFLAPYTDAEAGAMSEFARADLAHSFAKSSHREMSELLAAGKCPTCMAPVGPGSTVAKAVAEGDVLISLRASEFASVRERLTLCKDASAGALAWLENQLAAWRAELAALPRPEDRPRVEDAATAVANAKRRLADMRAAANPWTEAVAQAKAQRESLDREAAILREAASAADAEADIAQAWEDVLSPKGVRAHLSDGALAAIDAEANRWLSILSDGKLAVEFPSTRTTGKGATKEEIRTVVHARAPDGTSTTRDLLTFSGGERRRINIAVDLGVAAAFSRGGALALSLLVLDEECFSGCDAAGKRAIVTALSHAGVADVVVIDHDESLTAALPRTVYVSRGEDGWSRIREGA